MSEIIIVEDGVINVVCWMLFDGLNGSNVGGEVRVRYVLFVIGGYSNDK